MFGFFEMQYSGSSFPDPYRSPSSIFFDVRCFCNPDSEFRWPIESDFGRSRWHGCRPSFVVVINENSVTLIESRHRVLFVRGRSCGNVQKNWSDSLLARLSASIRFAACSLDCAGRPCCPQFRIETRASFCVSLLLRHVTSRSVSLVVSSHAGHGIHYLLIRIYSHLIRLYHNLTRSYNQLTLRCTVSCCGLAQWI